MKIILIFVLVSLFFVFTNCKEDSLVSNEQLALREGLSAQEFSSAIIGKWESVFEKEGEENIKYLEFDKSGDAKILLYNDSEKECGGMYILSFNRPPRNGEVTLAEITIKTESGNILLRQVNFGFHNAFPESEGLLLRVDDTPYGVLKKINN